MPSQSLACPVLLPSALVSPPAVSSSQEVNTTGEAAVPVAVSDPWTSRRADRPNLTTVPACTVRVTPDGTVYWQSMRYTSR